MKLEIEKIRLDGGTQPRAQIDGETVCDYAELMKTGTQFPPITVFFDGTQYWLADGFHRVTAAKLAQLSEIDAEILQGSLADAQWHSFGVNRLHGLRRNRKDGARAIQAALKHPHGAEKSDREIAEHVGCHFETVSKYRKQLEVTTTIGKTDSRQGRDGRTYNTTRIGKNHPKSGKGKKKTNKVSQRANIPYRKHSKPLRMIPVQFCPENPHTAAATLIQLFPRTFLEGIVAEITQHLNQTGVSS